MNFLNWFLAERSANMADEWTTGGYIDIGEDDGAAQIYDGAVDFWVQDSTNGWHYAPIND